MYFFGIAVANFAILAQPALPQGTNTTLPLIYRGKVLQGDGSQTCHSEPQRERVRNEVDSATLRLLRESVVPLLQKRFSCGESTGWKRVAYLNMSNHSQQCPSVWREYTTPHRVCGRKSNSSGSCEGLTYSTGSTQYDQVCGRIIGYQIGSPASFHDSGFSINTYYVGGISVTHGSPRKHIWTFAGGTDEQTANDCCTCPCVTGSRDISHLPSFVGQNYFCETGITRWSGTHGVFWPNSDPLWDGQGCGPTSSCCTFHSPPWFSVRLPTPTTDYIEVRICDNEGTEKDDTPIQFIELYVK